MPEVSTEENYKLFVAQYIFNGDLDAIAKYMGITKNAVSKRTKKIADEEKEKAAELGMLDEDATPKTPKKRPSKDDKGGSAKKKTKHGDDEKEHGGGADGEIKNKPGEQTE